MFGMPLILDTFTFVFPFISSYSSLVVLFYGFMSVYFTFTCMLLCAASCSINGGDDMIVMSCNDTIINPLSNTIQPLL